MEQAISNLANNFNLKLDNPIVNEAYKYIEERKNDPKIMEILNNHYRPTSIEIGTAGSYLWGCSQNYYGSVNKACSALCNGGLSYNMDNECQYQIWTYDDKLISTGHSSSSSAYIYVNSNWEGFNSKDIETLKKHGIEYVSILTTEDSKHVLKRKMLPLKDLPVISEDTVDEKEVSNNKYLYYFIVLFIIILAGFWKWRNLKTFYHA